MFGLFRRPAPRPLTAAIQHAIEQHGMTAAVSDPSRLRMVESVGRYSDRKVTYFRVFDPNSVGQTAPDIRRYQDFDVFPGLILRSGHVEKDGTVVLTRPVTARAAETPIRTNADRMAHTDDAHIVRGETGASPNPLTPRTSRSEHAV